MASSVLDLHGGFRSYHREFQQRTLRVLPSATTRPPRQILPARGTSDCRNESVFKAAGSWVIENRSERMIHNSYPLGFKIVLHRKKLGIGLELAQSVGAVLPVAALAAVFEDGLLPRASARRITRSWRAPFANYRDSDSQRRCRGAVPDSVSVLPRASEAGRRESQRWVRSRACR